MRLHFGDIGCGTLLLDNGLSFAPGHRLRLSRLVPVAHTKTAAADCAQELQDRGGLGEGFVDSGLFFVADGQRLDALLIGRLKL